MVLQRGFLFIDRVHALRLDHAAASVIIHEHVLLQHTAHVQHLALVVCPVECLLLRNEDLALGGRNQNVRLNVPERVLDQTVETIVDGHYNYKCGCTCRHTCGTYRGDNVDDIMGFLREKVTYRKSEDQVHLVTISSAIHRYARHNQVSSPDRTRVQAQCGTAWPRYGRVHRGLHVHCRR